MTRIALRSQSTAGPIYGSRASTPKHDLVFQQVAARHQAV